MEKGISNWLRFAEADMTSAEALHSAGQQLYALFHLQQAVEKTLKALLLKQTRDEPARIHSLRKLAERCGLALTLDQALLLENLSEYYIESRYPGDWQEESSEVMAKEVARLVPASKDFIQWLRSQI